ncbi:MAG: hypothetical protein GY757_02995, partial [bacterium]|nr:hypothetical protein [bacterium]
GYFVSRISYSGKESAAGRDAFYKGIAASRELTDTAVATLPEGMKTLALPTGDGDMELWLLKLFLGVFLDILLTSSGVEKTDIIKMPDGPDIKVEEVYTLKDRLLEYGYAKYEGDLNRLIRSLTACIDSDNLEWYATQLIENPENHLVVLGHTHARKDTDTQLNYANPACFCADTMNIDDGNPFYVEIDGDNAIVRPWNE